MTSDNTTPDTPGDDWQKKGRELVFRLSSQGVNVGQAERAVKGVLGAVLLARGLKHHTLGGTLQALVGALLVGEGITGHSRLYQWFGINHADAPPRPDAASHRTPSGQHSSALTNDLSLGSHHTSGELVAFITVGKTPDEVYEAWKKPDTLSQILSGALRVEDAGNGRMRWTLDAPLGQSVSWQTRVEGDVPGEAIKWNAVPDGAESQVSKNNGGEVSFAPAPGDRGTEITLRLRLASPLSAAPAPLAKVLKLVPTGAANKALRNFKALVESGEIPSLGNNVSARGERDKF